MRPFADPEARRGDVTIFHFALPSPMTEAFAALDGARVLQYHNITPAAFFAPYDPGLFRLAALGRQELAHARRPRRPGARRLRVQPAGARGARLRADRRHADCRRHRRGSPKRRRRPALEKILGDGLINILFVGRIVPNKRIEDHIRLAEMYKRYVDSYYRFIFVGRYDALPRYYAQVRALIAEYQMLPDRFWFTGPVPDEDLAAFYRWADAYVSLSEHEGFCVPLRRGHGGRRAGAGLRRGRRAGNARRGRRAVRAEGPRIRRRDAGHARIRSTRCGTSIIEGQRRRLADFAPGRIERRLMEVIASLLDLRWGPTPTACHRSLRSRRW